MLDNSENSTQNPPLVSWYRDANQKRGYRQGDGIVSLTQAGREKRIRLGYLLTRP